MQRVKPIYIINSAGVTEDERQAVKDGIKSLLEIVELEKEIMVHDLGYWDKESDGIKSIDWYLAGAERKTTNGYVTQFDSGKILKKLCEDSRYSIMIIDKDLTAEKEDGTWYNFIIGDAQRYICAVLSVKRFRAIPENHECIKTLVMHEFGHVFCAAFGKTGVDVLLGHSGNKDLKMNHCDQECVMRQGSRVPEAWIKISEDRLKSGKPFCKECINEMKRYLKMNRDKSG